MYDRTIDSVVSVQAGGGLGSGFVYATPQSDETYVVTNAHVVRETSTVTLRFPGGQLARGTVVGRDALTDLAAIRSEIHRPTWRRSDL